MKTKYDCNAIYFLFIFLLIFLASELKAGTITGRVLYGSAPVSGLWVDIYTPDYVHSVSVKTNSGGVYFVSNIPDGQYKINYFTYGTLYVTKWYNNKYYPPDANLISVTGDVSLDDVYLEKSFVTISGYVKNSSGSGISGAYVQVYDKYGDWVTVSGTDSNGLYNVTGIGTGEYTLRFLAAGTEYITEWYNDKDVHADADIIKVETLNDSISMEDAILDSGGSISGKITDSLTGNAIQNAWIDVYKPDSKGLPVWRGYAESGADGSYLVTGLPRGEHKIEVFKAYSTEPKEWYKNRSSFSSATPVPVNAGEETGGIDIALGPEPPTDLTQVYKLLLLKKRCTMVNGVRVCR